MSSTAEHRYRRLRRQALNGFLLPTLISWVVWTSSMLGEFPWPVFVTVVTGAPFVLLVTGKRRTMANIERNLERDAAGREPA